MERAIASSHIFRFGLFEADPARNTLTRNGVRVKIQEQPFRVLVLLMESAGEIVPREELRQELWPDGTYVDFDGSLNVILKKLRAAIDDDSDNPRFIETVPRRGYRFIAPVSVRAPVIAEGVKIETADPRAGEIRKAPEEIETGGTSRASEAGTKVRRYLITAGLAVVILGGLVWLGWHRRQVNASKGYRPAAATATAPVPLRKSIAILGFRNISGKAEDEWLATEFSEMLSTELAIGERLRLVSGEDVSNLRISSPWSQTGTLGRETTARVGAALNSDLLVLGSYASIGPADGGKLRLDVRLQDARTGEILTEDAELGSRKDLFRITTRVGASLRERLGVPALGEADAAGVIASLPLDPDAARFYALGIAKLREFDASAAKDLLEQASNADPKFSLVHAMLARAWSELGYEKKRKEEAKKALDLSGDLPRVERMQVEGDYYESLADHEKAASTYRALFELFPESVEYGLQLVAVQDRAGHRAQALETIGQLRRLPLPASGDPRIDIAEARILPKKPDSLALVHSALAKAESQGKKLVYAQAKRDECIYLVYSDSPGQGRIACEEAYKIYVAAGNLLGAADTVRLVADSEGAEGHTEQAIATYEKALNILQGLGEHEKSGVILNNMAINYANRGKLGRAEQLYRQAKSHFEQAGDKDNTATALGNIADIFYLRGNLAEASKLYEQTQELEESIDHSNIYYPLYRLADLQLAEGRVKDSQRLAQQAIDLLRPAQGGASYLTSAMNVLGATLEAEGDLNGARQQYEQALAIRQKLGEPLGESQVALAQLSIEEGHPEQAEPLLRPAIADFEKEKEDPGATEAYIVLSRALSRQGKLEEAAKAIQHAGQLARNSPDPALTLPVAIEKARIESAEAGQGAKGRAAQESALQQLRSAVGSARKLGYYTIECEARLVLGEVESKVNPVLGRSQLETLKEEAHERGLELVARKAQVLAAASQAPPSPRK